MHKTKVLLLSANEVLWSKLAMFQLARDEFYLTMARNAVELGIKAARLKPHFVFVDASLDREQILEWIGQLKFFEEFSKTTPYFLLCSAELGTEDVPIFGNWCNAKLILPEGPDDERVIAAELRRRMAEPPLDARATEPCPD